jgi:NAD(P)-dependent dehydrogenase (short-subunit alcohol dehydrogenase family)
MSEALSGRNALITGGTQGLGLEIARAYLEADAGGVCICGRDPAVLESAVTELQELARADQRVLGVRADVSVSADVECLVDSALTGLGELTILVSNAGIYGPKGMIDQTDWAEWVQTMEVNLFGSVLPIRALLPHFMGRAYGKIVQIAGAGGGALQGLSAYAASKAAIVRFCETLADELGERSLDIDVNAIAPGGLNTRMLDEVLAVGPERVGKEFYRRALAQQRTGGVSPRRGAELAVFLGSAASDGISGKLLSAVWDPWPELPQRKADLESDVYTLRRIVPADRGFDWGEPLVVEPATIPPSGRH